MCALMGSSLYKKRRDAPCTFRLCSGGALCACAHMHSERQLRLHYPCKMPCHHPNARPWPARLTWLIIQVSEVACTYQATGNPLKSCKEYRGSFTLRMESSLHACPIILTRTLSRICNPGISDGLCELDKSCSIDHQRCLGYRSERQHWSRQLGKHAELRPHMLMAWCISDGAQMGS